MLVLGSGSAPVAEAAAKVCIVIVLLQLCIIMCVFVTEDYRCLWCSWLLLYRTSERDAVLVALVEFHSAFIQKGSLRSQRLSAHLFVGAVTQKL
jgi:hypothetical protein